MIREASIEEIPKLLDLAEKFALTVPAMANFNREKVLESWTQFLDLNMGKILIFDDYSGMLAAMIHPDPYTGELTATEMAWFVDPDKRGGGLRLLVEFEKWAKNMGCKKIIMVCLLNEYSEILSKMYTRRGYVPIETHFMKDI